MPRSFSKPKHTPVALVLYAVLAGVGLMILFVIAWYAFSRDIRSVSRTFSTTAPAQQVTTTTRESAAVPISTSTAVAPDLTHRPLAFDPTVRKIGWKVGPFTLVSIGSPYGDPSNDVRPDWYGATFSGKATVTGRYVVTQSDFAGGPVAYFVPDPGSILPVDAAQGDDHISPSFYLDEKAETLLGKPETQGRATIEIDGYMLSVGGSEAGSWAKLVRVVRKLPSNNFDPSFSP